VTASIYRSRDGRIHICICIESDMLDTFNIPGDEKFRDPDVTAKGDARAHVSLTSLKTLWFNTGSLCNIACKGCYIESSPTNDRLQYISAQDVRDFLDQVDGGGFAVEEIGFTGGEPFMNREFLAMLTESLGRGYCALVLTNAMKPMHHHRAALVDLKKTHGSSLTIRVSIDHYAKDGHEAIRGDDTWEPMIQGLRWLSAEEFQITVAARLAWSESETALRDGYRELFDREKIDVDAFDPARLVLFPDMDPVRDVPEISVHCWGVLGVNPSDMMCATSRMVIKRKGADGPVIAPCTLLPYDPAFELGDDLRTAKTSVSLNHPFCAQFCVLGGASCSAS
jgi:organic radical activating enzyme